MKKTDFACEIRRVANGFVIKFYDKEMIVSESILTEHTITDSDNDELHAPEELLSWILDFFGYFGSKHDAERLIVCRELPQTGEIKYRDEIYVPKEK